MRLGLKDTTILLKSLFPALFSKLCHSALTHSLITGFLFFCGYTGNKITITGSVRKIDDVFQRAARFLAAYSTVGSTTSYRRFEG